MPLAGGARGANQGVNFDLDSSHDAGGPSRVPNCLSTDAGPELEAVGSGDPRDVSALQGVGSRKTGSGAGGLAADAVRFGRGDDADGVSSGAAERARRLLCTSGVNDEESLYRALAVVRLHRAPFGFRLRLRAKTLVRAGALRRQLLLHLRAPLQDVGAFRPMVLGLQQQ